MIQDMCILIRTFAIPTTFHIFALVEGWILYRVVYFLHNFEWRTWNLSLISKCTCNSTVKAIFFWLHNYSAQLLLTVHCSWKVNFFCFWCSHCFCLSIQYLSVSLPMSTMPSHYFWLWLCSGGWMKYYFIVVFTLFYFVKS